MRRDDMAISDTDLVYWLGVLFAARERGDAQLIDEALKALRERGVTIAFADDHAKGDICSAPQESRGQSDA